MKRMERIVQILILLFFIYYSQFYKLGSLAYRIWDEARLATSAYEMTKTGNLLVTTVNYQPDMWSTKPPMMIWAQAVCIKLHGLNEYSTRFPSAVSAMLTIFVVFFFVLYLTKNGWAALVSGLVLCTAQGYIGYHGTRYGEYDSMLTLFTTSYLLAFYLYTEEHAEDRKNKWLLLFFAALILAVLTKGIAALLFAPALFLYTIFRKQLLETLSNKCFYLGAISFLAVVFGYYMVREHYNAGYLNAVVDNELGGRFLREIEEHQAPPGFYYNNLKWERFGNWFWLLPTGLVLAFLNTNHTRLRTTLYAFLCASLFLVILSISKTKLWWYDLPTYSLFAIIIGLTVLQLGYFISILLPFMKKKIVFFSICVIACAQPVYEVFQFIRYSGDDLNKDSFYAASYYLRDVISDKKDLSGVVYFYHGYALQWILYVNRLTEQDMCIKQEDLNGKNEFNKGQLVIAHQSQTKDYLESNFTFTVKEEFYDMKVYEVTGVKPQTN